MAGMRRAIKTSPPEAGLSERWSSRQCPCRQHVQVDRAHVLRALPPGNVEGPAAWCRHVHDAGELVAVGDLSRDHDCGLGAPEWMALDPQSLRRLLSHP